VLLTLRAFRAWAFLLPAQRGVRAFTIAFCGRPFRRFPSKLQLPPASFLRVSLLVLAGVYRAGSFAPQRPVISGACLCLVIGGKSGRISEGLSFKAARGACIEVSGLAAACWAPIPAVGAFQFLSAHERRPRRNAGSLDVPAALTGKKRTNAEGCVASPLRPLEGNPPTRGRVWVLCLPPATSAANTARIRRRRRGRGSAWTAAACRRCGRWARVEPGLPSTKPEGRVPPRALAWVEPSPPPNRNHRPGV
jgi:hypothetical protein